MKRLVILAIAVALGGPAAGTLAGCAHPYSGPAERLKKPRKKRRKDAPPPVPESQGRTLSEAPCRTNFFSAPPRRLRRRPRDARNLALQADRMLLDAEQAEGEQRVTGVLGAINKLKSALRKDPYSPEATYKLSVAYALAGRKTCTVALLERLRLLQQYPDTEREAARVVQRAAREPVFEPFRKDALAALGE